MQLLHSGVILSGLPDYVNRLLHIKRGTGEGNYWEVGRAGERWAMGGGEGKDKSPKTYNAKAQTKVYSDALGLCVKTQAVRRYLPLGGETVQVATVRTLCISYCTERC